MRGKPDQAVALLRNKASLASGVGRDLLLLEAGRVWVGHGFADRAEAVLGELEARDPDVQKLVAQVRGWIERDRRMRMQAPAP